MRLQDGDGLDLLEQVRRSHPQSQVILITGYGDADAAVEALRAGAFDYLTKPLIDDELLLSIERALRPAAGHRRKQRAEAQLDQRFGLENIVGHDHQMLKMFDLIDSVADTKATVLITGESGTGKS